MIEIKYKQLFDLEFLHNFYSSGKSADFLVEPTIKCQMLLKSLGLKFLPTQFGGKLFAKVKTAGGKDIIKSPVPEGAKFTFLLKLKNKVFENFTKLNLDKPKITHYYFNNLINNISSAGFPLLVSNTGTKIVSDTDLMPFISNSFSFVHNNSAATQNSELKFIDSGETFQQSLQNHNNIFNFSYNLSKTPGGRAKFFIEGTEKAFGYVFDAANNTDLFGVVEIFYHKNLPAAYLFQNPDNSIETKFYKIIFSNRSTKWRYLITKKFNLTVTGVKVAKTNGTPISFTEQVISPPASQFIVASNNPVPLKEEPVSGIKLSDQTNKVILSNLPNPSLTLIRTEGADTFSDILITI